MTLEMNLILPSLILGLGAIDDIVKRKVHNILFLVSLGCALAYSLYSGGLAGLSGAFLSCLMAFILTFPLFRLKMLGGGDVKIFLAFAAATTTGAVLNVMLYSLVWGAVLGILISLFNKNIKVLLSNFIKILKLQKPESELHKIPFTVALFMGWLSHLIVEHYGRVL